MTKKYIKNFSAEYKTKVVLELLDSELTISQLSKKIRNHTKDYPKLEEAIFEQCFNGF